MSLLELSTRAGLRMVSSTSASMAKEISNQVAYMIHHFFSSTCPMLVSAKIMHLHSDSCTGQNKNNNALGYLMMSAEHRLNDEIMSHFMAAEHTKFRIDEGFGAVRKHVSVRANVLSLPELQAEIEGSTHSSPCVVFPVDEVKDWKQVRQFFNLLQGIRENVA